MFHSGKNCRGLSRIFRTGIVAFNFGSVPGRQQTGGILAFVDFAGWGEIHAKNHHHCSAGYGGWLRVRVVPAERADSFIR